MNVELDPWVVYLLTLGMDIEKNPGPDRGEAVNICNMNLRSINAKARYPGGLTRFEAFRNAVVGSYDIVTATETWLTPEHPDDDYRLDGFQGPFRLDRPDGTGHGGVAAWVNDSLISREGMTWKRWIMKLYGSKFKIRTNKF